MNIVVSLTGATLALAFATASALAGIVAPDCTAEKAAKSAATKATVGVGGRCSAGEAAKDQGMKAAGVEQKDPIEKMRSKNDTPAERVKDAAKRATK